jgi:hypothetical protein
MNARRSVMWVVGCLGAVAACSFEGANSTTPKQMNMCGAAKDCAAGSACVDGMCQAQAADTTLTIELQVTPLHMPNGSNSLPILLGPIKVSGPLSHDFALPSSVSVSGLVRAAGLPIEAEVSFTPVQRTPGIAPGAVMAMTSTAPSDRDYTVRLLKDVDYRMVVRPTDMSFAPYAKTFTAGSNVDLNVDFVMLDTTKRTIVISGAPSDRDLLVTAFDAMTGEAISSTATVTTGKATLLFAPNAPDQFRLEIRASQTYDSNGMKMMSASLCDTDTPAFPVFSALSSDLSTDANGQLKIALPPQLDRIRYSGTVELCPDEAANTSKITDLPITLHAQTLSFEKETKLSASFDTTTSANYDSASKSLRFCVEVMPGEYDVLATPPASMRCALFAERREIQAPPDTTANMGELLTLPEAAYLTGTLQAMGPSPLSGASVEAIALGQSDVIPLPGDDLSVTRYNRSSQTTSSADGSFKLPVDLGAYDVVIKPPIDSGFPWQVNNDIKVGLGARKMPLNKTIDMPSPVVVTGTLRYPGANADAQATLQGAEIDAYAIIPIAGDDTGATRAVTIGKTAADDQGKFMLLLPPKTQRDW